MICKGRAVPPSASTGTERPPVPCVIGVARVSEHPVLIICLAVPVKALASLL